MWERERKWIIKMGFPLDSLLIVNESFTMLLCVFPFAEIPDAKPFIDGIMTRYRPGDEVKGNCTSQFSKPAANVSWSVNDVPVCIISLPFFGKLFNRLRLIFHQVFNSINNGWARPDLKNLELIWIPHPYWYLHHHRTERFHSNAVSMFATQTSSFTQPEMNDDFIYVAISRVKMIFRQIDSFLCLPWSISLLPIVH